MNMYDEPEGQPDRLHPEGVPGQIELDMRRLLGDRNYEQVKDINQRHSHALIDLVSAKAMLWRNLVTLTTVLTFAVLAAAGVHVLRELAATVRGDRG